MHSTFKTYLLLLTLATASCATSNEIVVNKPDIVVPIKSDVSYWLTSPANYIYLQKQSVSLIFTNTSNSYPTIEVDSTTTYQSMDGFGFALTGGSASLINNLPALKRADLLKELFGSDSTAIGINYLRISIGASDLDSYVFSYDDNNSTADTTLQSFSIQPDMKDLIPILKSIVAINPTIKIMATPWSAPAWMKTNKSAKGGSLKSEYYGAYARYFVKYIQAMKEQGITIDAITPQNEPLNPDNNPSMYMSALDQATFIKNHLGPAFYKSNISSKIILFDHNCDVSSYPLSILDDAAAAKYVDGSAFHLYAGNITALLTVHNAHPEKNVYFTEQWVGGPSNFGEDLKWHIKNLIIGAPRNWSKNVIEWNLASDPNYFPHTPGGCSTCLGAITVGNDVTRNVGYYIIAHASKFVPMGSVRIKSSITGNIANVAFITPNGKKVVIALNEGNATESFNLRFNNKIITLSLPSGGVASYVW